jgi:hypothetical protein
MLCFVLLALSGQQLLHIKTLGETYLEAKMNQMEMIGVVENMDPPFKEIPVKLPNKTGHVYAKVSTEDYEKVEKSSNKWRLCSSGYPLFVERKGPKFVTTYMHRLIFGKSARHLNGDRLDNRQENLIESSRRTRSYADDEIVIKKPRVVAEEMVAFDSKDCQLPLYTGYANINYDHKKLFSGEVSHGIPHGYGCLYEQATQRESRGMWKSGHMVMGIVVKFKELPLCMCQVEPICPFREVEKVEVVKDGYKF